MSSISIARASRGYSVFELVVAMAIAAILLALAAPRFARFRDAAAVRAATTDLGAMFSMARHTAMAQRTLVTLAIDTVSGTVEVRSSGNRVVKHSLRNVYGIVLGSNRDSTVYDPRGLGYGVSNLSVTIRSGSIVDTLTISKLGRVRW